MTFFKSGLPAVLGLSAVQLVGAYSLSQAESGVHRKFTLVAHTSQLEQSMRPPHLFALPAPGGPICLVVDENQHYHAIRDSCPPLGMPISEWGVVDTQVNVIEDMLFGNRFNLADGSLRGRWCPGGSAGPLLRAARILRGAARPLQRRREQSRSLEVFPTQVEDDGSLTVTLPNSSAVPGLTSAAWAERFGLTGYDF